RGGRVDVGGRPHRLGDPRERHLLAEELAAPADEVVHGAPASGREGLAAGGWRRAGAVELGVEVPASGSAGAGGRGGPFAPQYAVASRAATTAARSIRTGWRG